MKMMGWKKKREKSPHGSLHPKKRKPHECGGHTVYMPKNHAKNQGKCVWEPRLKAFLCEGEHWWHNTNTQNNEELNNQEAYYK